MSGKTFLEAQKEAGRETKKSIVPEENKMQPGNRIDQKNPQDLVSGMRGKSTKEAGDLHALAKELRVNLRDVRGTGPNRSITEEDVRKAAKPQGATAGGGTSHEHITENEVRQEKAVVDARDEKLRADQKDAQQEQHHKK